MLEELIQSGRIVDIMIAVIVLETLVLLAYRRTTGRGIAPGRLIANIGAGGSLMLALRAVFADAHWGIIAACLIASLLFHVTDLRLRWNRS